MLPVIAIVGRPNVGKSTLFNCLTRSRHTAIVADQPGITRDRQYGLGRVGEAPYWVIDTGGLGETEDAMSAGIEKQALLALKEADHVFFLLDARDGLTVNDQKIAAQLRQANKPVTLVLNKIDGVDTASIVLECYALGFDEPLLISSAHNQGILNLVEHTLAILPATNNDSDASLPDNIKNSIRVAIIGKPNVGKSTLVNRILGEERVLVYDQPGTTRDSIYIPFTRFDKNYTLIDTAGVRRRGRIDDPIEKFSVVKSLQAIRETHVVILVIDAREGIAEQDLRLIGHVLESGRSLILTINKWDGMTADEKEWVKRELDRRLDFIDYAEQFFISALHGTNVGLLYDAISRAYHSSTMVLSTPQLTRILQKALEEHQPPLVRGKQIKLRYAHQGGQNPPRIVIHGNRTDELPGSYQRYLGNVFRHELQIVGTPVVLEFKKTSNPFAHVKNELTPRQVKKHQRLMSFAKKQKKKR